MRTPHAHRRTPPSARNSRRRCCDGEAAWKFPRVDRRGSFICLSLSPLHLLSLCLPVSVAIIFRRKALALEAVFRVPCGGDFRGGGQRPPSPPQGGRLSPPSREGPGSHQHARQGRGDSASRSADGVARVPGVTGHSPQPCAHGNQSILCKAGSRASAAGTAAGCGAGGGGPGGARAREGTHGAAG